MSTATTAAARQPQDLSPDARNAVETKKISGAWTGRALVKLLGELEKWDLEVEGRRATTNKIWIGCIVGSVLGFFAMFVVGAITESFLIAPWFFLVPLAATFYFRKKLNELMRADMPDEIRTSIRPMLKQLNQDLHPDQKIRVEMNLAGLDESKATRWKNLPPGRNRSLKLSTFECELCDLRLPLADGSAAVLRLANVFHRLERSYKTPRGKYKTKYKWKKQTTATAMLIPSAPMSWQPAKMEKYIEKSCERLTFAEKNGVMVARLDRYYKFKNAGSPPKQSLPSADIIGLFVRLAGMRPVAAGEAR